MSIPCPKCGTPLMKTALIHVTAPADQLRFDKTALRSKVIRIDGVMRDCSLYCPNGCFYDRLDGDAPKEEKA